MPHESVAISYASSEMINARHEIYEQMNLFSGSTDEKERSMGLFVRASLLARFLAISDLYKLIIGKPGCILDLGTWRGQTAILCENYRAIFEPLHFNRRILAFDTFDGYLGFTEMDKSTLTHQDGTYKVGGSEYANYLSKLLVMHEQANAMGHVNHKHQVIKGDIRQTLPIFFNENPNEIVSLAFFDVNSYAPTAEAFNQVWQRLIPGGVVAFWQLTRKDIPAEGRFYSNEVLNSHKHKIYTASTYPGLCYIVK